MSKSKRIKARTRKWLIHYHRMGNDARNFGQSNGMNGYWPISPSGVSGVRAFHHYESTGEVLPTRCPRSIEALTAGKAMHGMTIKMWAEDWLNCLITPYEIKKWCNGVPGMFNEVEQAKRKASHG